MSDHCLKILLVHGWCANQDLWQPAATQLSRIMSPANIEYSLADPVWIAGDHDLQPAELPAGKFDLAVGHSAGLLWLLARPSVSFDRLVSVAGFTRFCRGPGFRRGWPVAVIERMIRRMSRDAAGVVSDFRKNATTTHPNREEYPCSGPMPDAVRLESGLQALSSVDVREQWSLFSGPRQVIAGTEDRIVTADHTRSCFGSDKIEWIKTDSHWIPWTFPQTCAALLRETITTT